MIEWKLCVGFFIVGVIVGIWIGQFATNHRWKLNADEPMRILYKGLFYKVVRIRDEKSERYYKDVD